MFVGGPKSAVGSYQATHGTVRPGPAKSIDGASASTFVSMFSDAGNPCVTQAPFLNARTNICCDSPVFCSKVAQGTWTFPATTVPPVTSETPASWFGSIEFTGSLFTCAPLAGSGTKAALAPVGSATIAASARVAAARRTWLAKDMEHPSWVWVCGVDVSADPGWIRIVSPSPELRTGRAEGCSAAAVRRVRTGVAAASGLRAKTCGAGDLNPR